MTKWKNATQNTPAQSPAIAPCFVALFQKKIPIRGNKSCAHPDIASLESAMMLWTSAKERATTSTSIAKTTFLPMRLIFSSDISGLAVFIISTDISEDEHISCAEKVDIAAANIPITTATAQQGSDRKISS